MNISAIIVTKCIPGSNVVLIRDALKRVFDEVIVWDNDKAIKDVKVFGRFAGANIARNDLIYVQDDDCMIKVDDLTKLYLPLAMAGKIVCNMPQDRRAEYRTTGISLIGWGTLFMKHHMHVFDTYFKFFPFDDLFLRECDRVFSYMNRNEFNLVDVGLEHLDIAHGMDRMGREPRHRADLLEIRRRLGHINRSQLYEDTKRRVSLGISTV